MPRRLDLPVRNTVRIEKYWKIKPRCGGRGVVPRQAHLLAKKKDERVPWCLHDVIYLSEIYADARKDLALVSAPLLSSVATSSNVDLLAPRLHVADDVIDVRRRKPHSSAAQSCQENGTRLTLPC